MPVAPCPDPDLLRQLARGRVSAVTERELDRHLAACPPCADAHNAILAPVARAVRRFAAEPDLPPADRLIDRVRALYAANPTPSVSVSTNDAAGDVASRTAVAAGRSTTELPAYRADEPDRIGKFVIRGRIGSGGMGDVFRAQDDTLHREVALKLLQVPGGVTPTPGERWRLIEEARAAARVEHPHIVRVYEVGEAGDVPYIAMELLRGETLTDRLKREKSLPAAEVCRLGAQMAEGLAAAHAAGLIHRDIKPGNLWLEPGRGGPTVRILDFGLARGGAPAEPDSTPSAVQVSSRAGTPAYMSPEQAAGRELDARSDLFSLGLVLYEMAAGRRLIAGARTSEVMATVSGYRPPPAAKLLPGVPAPLAAVIAGLLHNDRDRRSSQTASAAADRLATLAAGFTRRRNPLAWVVCLLLLMVGATVLGQYVIRIKRNESDPGVELTVAPGTKVGVGPDGATTVTLPPGSARPIPPTRTGPTLDHLRRESIPPTYLAAGAPTWLAPEVVGFVGHPLQALSGWNDRYVGGMTNLSLLPDGKTLVTTGHTGEVRLWDLSGPQSFIVSEFKPSDHPSFALAVTRAGNRVAVGDTKGRISLWSLPDAKQSSSTDADGAVTALAFSPDGKELAAALDGYTAKIYQGDKLAPAGEVPLPRQNLMSVCYVRDGTTLVVGGRGVIRAVERRTDKEVLGQAENRAWFTSLSLTTDGRWLGTNGGVAPRKLTSLLNFFDDASEGPKTDGNVFSVRDVNSEFAINKRLRHPSDTNAAPERVMRSAFSPDGTRLATLTAANRITIWDWASERAAWQVVIQFPTWAGPQPNGLASVAYHPDGRHLLVATTVGYALILRLPPEALAPPTTVLPPGDRP